MVKKRLNKRKLLATIFSFIIIIGFIVFFILMKQKKNSIEYKLEVIGYNESETEYIKQNFKEDEINKTLNMNYSEHLINFYKEKYFRFDKLDNYLNYYSNNKKTNYEETIMKINTHRDIKFYDKIFDADLSKNELILVNKYYKLSAEYIPEDLIVISNMYAYSDKYISNSIMQNIIDLITAAKESGYTLIVSAGYRSYENQEKAYNVYKMSNGVTEADNKVARAGHSDYQTGLSFILQPYGKTIANAEESEENIWILENAHKYGFIQRYPKGKEDITGFAYEPWRLRYVGVEASTYIHKNNITFEEYYGYKF